MGIDLQLLQNDKGGNFEAVCASQKKRFAPEELAHDVLALYKEWTKSESEHLEANPYAQADHGVVRAAQFEAQQLAKQVNALKKDLGKLMKVRQRRPAPRR